MTKKPLTLFFIALQLLWGSSCCSQSKSRITIPHQKITSLKVSGVPSKHIDERRILKLISSQPGTMLDEAKIERDIKSVMASGLVDDVDFLIDTSGNGVELIVDVMNARWR